MSLDIYLTEGVEDRECRCPVCGDEHSTREDRVAFSANITHNLNEMAAAAGFYGVLRRPEENGIETAGQLAPYLEQGVKLLREQPERFDQYNASNGWGTREQLIPWLGSLLAACREYPESKVKVSV